MNVMCYLQNIYFKYLLMFFCLVLCAVISGHGIVYKDLGDIQPFWEDEMEEESDDDTEEDVVNLNSAPKG